MIFFKRDSSKADHTRLNGGFQHGQFHKYCSILSEKNNYIPPVCLKFIINPQPTTTYIHPHTHLLTLSHTHTKLYSTQYFHFLDLNLWFPALSRLHTGNRIQEKLCLLTHTYSPLFSSTIIIIHPAQTKSWAQISAIKKLLKAEMKHTFLWRHQSETEFTSYRIHFLFSSLKVLHLCYHNCL